MNKSLEMRVPKTEYIARRSLPTEIRVLCFRLLYSDVLRCDILRHYL